MYKFIPTEDRNKYRCCVCGSQPVKYTILTHNPLEGEGFYNLPYCNRCALLHSALVEKNKEKRR